MAQPSSTSCFSKVFSCWNKTSDNTPPQGSLESEGQAAKKTEWLVAMKQHFQTNQKIYVNTTFTVVAVTGGVVGATGALAIIAAIVGGPLAPINAIVTVIAAPVGASPLSLSIFVTVIGVGTGAAGVGCIGIRYYVTRKPVEKKEEPEAGEQVPELSDGLSKLWEANFKDSHANATPEEKKDILGKHLREEATRISAAATSANKQDEAFTGEIAKADLDALLNYVEEYKGTYPKGN